MSHLLVLGEGWVGSAVVRSATAVGLSVSSIDPPFDATLRARDRAATDALRALVRASGTTSVVNACGRVRGSDAELDDANRSFPEWLCEALVDSGVRLVHVGSASEYGDPGTAAPVAEQQPERAVGAYAETKAAGTHVVLRNRDRGLDATVARVFNIVGDPIPAVSPIHQWLTDLRALPPEGGELEVWWPATTRDFVTVDDAARALVDLATLDAGTPPLVNICSGVGLSFGAIVEAIASQLGIDVTVKSLDRPGIETVVGDPSLLRETIGWVPAMDAAALAACVTGGDGASDR